MNVNTVVITEPGHRLRAIGNALGIHHSRNLQALTVYLPVHKVGPSVASGAHPPQQWALILGGVEECEENFISAIFRIM